MADGSGVYNAPAQPAQTNQPQAASTLTADQIAAMNAQTDGYKSQTAALQAQINAQNEANKAGPEMMYNPLNENGSLKDQWKLGSADSYTASLKKQEELNGAGNRDKAAMMAQTGIAQSKENLAMRGGAGTNNSALLESQGMKQGLANQQSASNQTAQNLNSIGVQGAGAQLQVDKQNLQNQFGAAQKVNDFNLDKYNQAMGVKAADTQAKATESASNSGGK